jgi:hypothetical protein
MPSPHASATPWTSITRDVLGLARSESLCVHGNTLRENREVPELPAVDGAAGRVGKSKDPSRR